MSEEKQSEKEEVLLEKVREIEAQKRKAGTADNQDNTAVLLKENQRLSPLLTDDEAKRRMRRYSRRGFLIGGSAAVLAYLGYDWLRKPENTSIFTKGFRINEGVSQLYYSPKHLAPEFSPAQALEPRVNGDLGFNEGFDPAEWKLQVVGVANERNYSQFTDVGLVLTLDDIKKLPRIEMTTQLKCIEGWSVIVNWAGIRFSDFAEKYNPAFSKYVSLMTPDGGYYVGWDMPSILHPQTLLAYEMNGSPLTLPHGAPLRLVTTTKYGIKQIKRIGRIEFTDERPADYWAEQGYDWYSGH